MACSIRTPVTPARSRGGFLSVEALVFLAWLGVGVALILPLLVWARELAGSEGMGFGVALWAEMRRHWLRSALMGGSFLIAFMVVVVRLVTILTEGDPEGYGPGEDE